MDHFVCSCTRQLFPLHFNTWWWFGILLIICGYGTTCFVDYLCGFLWYEHVCCCSFMDSAG